MPTIPDIRTGVLDLPANRDWLPFNQCDVYLECLTNTGPITINLPLISGWDTKKNIRFYVADQTGNAATNPITINALGGNFINGGTTFTLNTNGGSCFIIITNMTNYLCFVGSAVVPPPVIPPLIIGDIDVATDPNYPAATAGQAYRVINSAYPVAHRIGGVNGKQADVGDVVYCLVDNPGGDQASVGSSWFIWNKYVPLQQAQSVNGGGLSAVEQVVLGSTANKAQGPNSMALGNGTEAVGTNATSKGSPTRAIGTNATAEGSDTHANNGNSHAEGIQTQAGTQAYTFTKGIGNQVIIAGNVTADFQSGGFVNIYDLVGGVSNTVFSIQQLLIQTIPVFGGVNTTFNVQFLAANMGDRTGGVIVMSISNWGGHAEGFQTKARGQYSHTEGDRTETTMGGFAAHAEGTATSAQGTDDHAEGLRSIAKGGASHAEGIDAVASGSGSHAEGSACSARGINSHAEGRTTFADGTDSHAEGSVTHAVGDHSHAEGADGFAVGDRAHVEGDDNKASGTTSHAEGMDTRAGNDFDTCTISGTTITIPGDVTTKYVNGDTIKFFSLTGGTANTLFVASRVINSVPVFGGVNTTFTISVTLSDRTAGLVVDPNFGEEAHAEGKSTVAEGDQSHAEGLSSSAIGDQSHAEGNSTGAIGTASHAEGAGTLATGEQSHAEGRGTQADGDFSSAGGRDSIGFFTSQRAFSSGQIAAPGDAQGSKIHTSLQTTDGSSVEIVDLVTGASIIPQGASQLWLVTIDVSAIQIGGAAGAFGDHYVGTVKYAVKTVSSVLTPCPPAQLIFSNATGGVGASIDTGQIDATGKAFFKGDANRVFDVSVVFHITEVGI